MEARGGKRKFRFEHAFSESYGISPTAPVTQSWHGGCELARQKMIRRRDTMNPLRSAPALLALIALVSASCAPLSRPVTHREQTAAVGALAGGAGGAIIGSLVGSAVTGGLFGMPIGAVAGYYLGDRMAQEDRIAQARLEERDAEIERLRRENERLRRENGGTRQSAR